MGLNPGELLIDDDFTDTDQLFSPIINGQKKARGAVPRDYSVQPTEMFAPPSEIKLIPRSEWEDRIREKERLKTRISDILLAGDKGKPIPSTDQNGHGYCWAYSTVGCVQAIRAINNQPYVRLNPHAVAAIIKNGRDEGGWCGLSAQFLKEHGVPSFEFWPEHSRSLSNDTREMRANAALHKVTEDWVDLTKQVYDRNLTFDQVASCLLSNIPVAGDFNWWGHSVLLCDLVLVESGSFGIRSRNSWTDGWGDRGFSVHRGQKAIPDGAVALRVTGGTPK